MNLYRHLPKITGFLYIMGLAAVTINMWSNLEIFTPFVVVFYVCASLALSIFIPTILKLEDMTVLAIWVLGFMTAYAAYALPFDQAAVLMIINILSCMSIRVVR